MAKTDSLLTKTAVAKSDGPRKRRPVTVPTVSTVSFAVLRQIRSGGRRMSYGHRRFRGTVQLQVPVGSPRGGARNRDAWAVDAILTRAIGKRQRWTQSSTSSGPPGARDCPLYPPLPARGPKLLNYLMGRGAGVEARSGVGGAAGRCGPKQSPRNPNEAPKGRQDNPKSSGSARGPRRP